MNAALNTGLNAALSTGLNAALNIVAAAALTLLGAAEAEAGCGPVPEACSIGGGTYHISLPPAPLVQTPADEQSGKTASKPMGPLPAVIFLHGYGSSGTGALKNKAMVSDLHARGYAVIAPDATPRPGGKRSWVFFPGWEGRDDTAFLRAVLADAAGRFRIAEERTVLAGFSAGAFMVSYLACAAPDSFAAYAPVSGGFWRPMPERCEGPVRLYQSHGWNDPVVPLEGRILGQGRFEQGDIFAGLQIWRAANGCATDAPTGYSRDGGLLRRDWHCGPGAALSFELFPGGHQVPKGWGHRMLDWFEAEQGAS